MGFTCSVGKVSKPLCWKGTMCPRVSNVRYGFIRVKSDVSFIVSSESVSVLMIPFVRGPFIYRIAKRVCVLFAAGLVVPHCVTWANERRTRQIWMTNTGTKCQVANVDFSVDFNFSVDFPVASTFWMTRRGTDRWAKMD